MNFKLYIQKIFRIILMLFFRFDYWHTSPLENRKYAIDIITSLNNHIPGGSIIEIGCGLGDILMKANYRKKYFYDISPEVLKAAAFLQRFSQKPSINYFKTFDLINDSLNKNLKFDTIIMVNWIHCFNSVVIKSRLSEIIKNNLNERGLIVFDIIENNKNYKFNHSVSDLIDLERFTIKEIDGYPYGRKLIFAELI